MDRDKCISWDCCSECMNKCQTEEASTSTVLTMIQFGDLIKKENKKPNVTRRTINEVVKLALRWQDAHTRSELIKQGWKSPEEMVKLLQEHGEVCRKYGEMDTRHEIVKELDRIKGNGYTRQSYYPQWYEINTEILDKIITQLKE